MSLDAELGKTMLQLITSRYEDRHWRKKIEKTLGLPQSGVGDEHQQQVFMYLKLNLKAYKSRRADPDSWILGGYATKEVIDRAKFQPHLPAAAPPPAPAAPAYAPPSVPHAHEIDYRIEGEDLQFVDFAPAPSVSGSGPTGSGA